MEKSNFEFLKGVNDTLYALAVSAEKNIYSDPHTTLLKIRLMSEDIIKHVAQLVNIDTSLSTFELIKELHSRNLLDDERKLIFDTLRKHGNKAAHCFYNNPIAAQNALAIAHQAATIYYRVKTGNGKFKPAKFIIPKESDELFLEQQSQQEILNLQQTINQLMQQKQTSDEALADHFRNIRLLEGRVSILQSSQSETELQAKARIEALEAELEQNKLESTELTNDELAKKQKASAVILKRSRFNLSEKETQFIIDQQLRDAGWEAESDQLHYQKGTRPIEGRNLAIAQYPTDTGPADYVLFVGLTPIAVVEAKRKNKNVSGAITQAERYSRSFSFDKVDDGLIPAWKLCGKSEPWCGADTTEGNYQLPFIFSCNGRPYLKQSAELSGTWFRDCRLPSNTKRVCHSFLTPEGMLDLLKRDHQKSQQELMAEPFDYLSLYPFQKKAVIAVEEAIQQGQRDILLAMATGTGKTRTMLAMLYRFLKAERFKRILFLVDRSSLGEQAIKSFKNTRLERNMTLDQFYDLKEMSDAKPTSDTRIQVATVQAMVRRLFDETDKAAIPVDQYDCIIVDESHRGYTLDQEMGEGELVVRDANAFRSTYRRVLDYFDAIKIGLTATPAAHTVDIFGTPVFTYSYSEAVAEDYLIDHESPIRYKTQLSEGGINYTAGESITVVDTKSGEVSNIELEDELNFNIDSFNRKIVNENFDRVVCEALAKDLDPLSEEKTLIFCVTDAHADRVERLLIDALQKEHGKDVPAHAVQKITGSIDKVDEAIRHFKNEQFPNIAITVDLLTTGIDVPKICNLVFMRRVKSRILYEQMLGRATRRCDEIGKTVFRIYDPVDLYATLQQVNTMKPIVKRPDITIGQLIDEISAPDNLHIAGENETDSFAHDALNELSQKVMRVMRKAQKKAEKNPELKEELDLIEQQWGVPASQIHQMLYKVGPQKAAELLQKHGNFVEKLENIKQLLKSSHIQIISDKEDQFIEKTQVFADFTRPEDYLSAFDRFIKQSINESIAMKVVVSKPKELTREQLKEIKLLLANQNFKEADLQSAWKKTTNVDIAASIIGHIRRAALGEPLIPFERRIDIAMDKIYAMNDWSKGQIKWLNRIAKQLKFEIVLQRNDIDEIFEDFGGVEELNENLDGQFDQVMDVLTDQLWNISV